MRALFQFFLVILFLGLTAAFAALNDGIITINYFVGKSDVRLTYLLLACFALGGLMSLLLISVSYLKLRLDVRKLNKAVSLNSQELSNLRALPVKDPY
ncbi:MAG: hypothetical protein COA74_07850 [Gammaproteobacteria bacterium]|nr:MAG: hypothetical protein COA74_07850 [Gammaproteobacteria bacterium]